jgi:hypothetical protein
MTAIGVPQFDDYGDAAGVAWRHECACGGQRFEMVAKAHDVLGGELVCTRCAQRQPAAWVYDGIGGAAENVSVSHTKGEV